MAVYLVGMMGAGKTTVGKKLAKALSREFIDLDHEIEHSTGVTIPTIFEIEGEAGFRRRESQVLMRLRDGGLVVATGGGVVLNPANRAWMAARGLVVYLHASAELLYARTKNDKGRPLLQVSDPLARIRSLVERRDPLYREIADIVVESGAGVSNTVNCIQKSLESPCTL
ncbi:MAG: shikimate kinase [Rhodocyclaceae bacterium]|jgi:shikimate kinase|nr:shikimate kinase [Rhodocyclaceae bacterium]